MLFDIKFFLNFKQFSLKGNNKQILKNKML